jgi:hypothetical protein
LISIAGKPTLSVTVFRLALAGLIPIKKIWELTEGQGWRTWCRCPSIYENVSRRNHFSPTTRFYSW